MKGSDPNPTPEEIVDAILAWARTSTELPPGDPEEEERRYQQQGFSADAIEKAERVVGFVRDCVPKVDPARVVYVSLGGGDGSEIAHAMRTGGFKRGLLLEWMNAAAKEAEKKAADLKKDGLGQLEVICGDLAQHLEGARRWLRKWREEPSLGIDGLLISAQAVLHELPERADARRYHFSRILPLYDDFRLRLFHGREPCCPGADDGWLEPVRFKVPGWPQPKPVPACKVVAACNLLRGRFPHYYPGIRDQDSFDVGDGFVRAPGPLAVEFLHKFLRFRDAENLRHEMQECLVGLKPRDVHDHLATVFGGVQNVRMTRMVTGGFREAYQTRRVEASSADSPTRSLAAPLAFATFEAFHVSESEGGLAASPGLASILDPVFVVSLKNAVPGESRPPSVVRTGGSGAGAGRTSPTGDSEQNRPPDVPTPLRAFPAKPAGQDSAGSGGRTGTKTDELAEVVGRKVLERVAARARASLARLPGLHSALNQALEVELTGKARGRAIDVVDYAMGQGLNEVLREVWRWLQNRPSVGSWDAVREFLDALVPLGVDAAWIENAKTKLVDAKTSRADHVIDVPEHTDLMLAAMISAAIIDWDVDWRPPEGGGAPVGNHGMAVEVEPPSPDLETRMRGLVDDVFRRFGVAADSPRRDLDLKEALEVLIEQYRPAHLLFPVADPLVHELTRQPRIPWHLMLLFQKQPGDGGTSPVAEPMKTHRWVHDILDDLERHRRSSSGT